MTDEPTQIASKVRYGAARLSYRLSSSLSTMLTLNSLRIKNCFKSISAIKVASMKIADDFYFEWKLSRATNAPINVIPHLPPPGRSGGNGGDLTL